MRNLQLPLEIINSLGVPQIEDITDKLPINPKYSWSKLAGVRELNELTTIALHHDAWPKKNTIGKYTDLQLASKIATDHIKSTKNEVAGDAGFPYHFWVYNGKSYQTNNMFDRTYGIGSNNGYTVHICVSGDYHNFDTLTDADAKALCAIIMVVKGALPKFRAIKGHGEIVSTHCPGYSEAKIRDMVASIENEILYKKSAEHKKAVALRIGSNILWYSRLANGLHSDNSPATPGQIDWAQNKLLQLEPIMESLEMLK